MRQIILDTETTGLHVNQGDRIVEIGCIELLNRSISNKKLHLYINPEKKISSESLKIHGLTNDFLSNKPKFIEVVDYFLKFIEDSELIIHNASFDVNFLNSELSRIGKKSIFSTCKKVTDSLSYARKLYPGKRNSLDALCERYKISNQQRNFHGALLDSYLLAQIWIIMTRGQEKLITNYGRKNKKIYKLNNSKKNSLSILKIQEANKNELKNHKFYMENIKKNIQ